MPDWGVPDLGKINEEISHLCYQREGASVALSILT